jgi:hypothetical protein
MRRVRGEIPSQSGRKQGQGKAQKLSDSGGGSSRGSRSTVTEPYGYHGAYQEGVHPSPYVKRKGHHFDVIARPYKSGVVGSYGEVDWSVRSSYLPVGFIQNLKRWSPTLYGQMSGFFRRQEGGRELRLIKPEHRPPKGFQIFQMVDEQVRNWTKIANLLGIQYTAKDRYYKFPKEMLGTLNARSGIYYTSQKNPFVFREGKEEFKFLVVSGIIRHKRSEIARIRRAARRAVDAVVKPLHILDVMRRERISCNAARELGIKTSQRPVELMLQIRRRRIPVSDTVRRAVYKLFSRVVYCDVIRVPGCEPQPELPRVVRQTVYRSKADNIIRKGALLRVTRDSRSSVAGSTIPSYYMGSDSDHSEVETPRKGKFPFGETTRAKRDISKESWW